MPPRIPGTAALVVVDVQDGFDAPAWGARNNPDAERNVARLLAAWRAAGRPVAHVQHASRDAGSPLHPHHPGHAIKREAALGVVRISTPRLRGAPAARGRPRRTRGGG